MLLLIIVIQRFFYCYTGQKSIFNGKPRIWLLAFRGLARPIFSHKCCTNHLTQKHTWRARPRDRLPAAIYSAHLCSGSTSLGQINLKREISVNKVRKQKEREGKKKKLRIRLIKIILLRDSIRQHQPSYRIWNAIPRV